MRAIRGILRDSRGGTAIEYALVASLIAIAAITAFKTLGGNVENKFENVSHIVDES